MDPGGLRVRAGAGRDRRPERGRDARPRLLVADDLDAAPPALLTRSPARPAVRCSSWRSSAPPRRRRSWRRRRCSRSRRSLRAAIERIARLHLPAAADVPVRELLAETGGVPLVVHRAATAWARARVTERLAATIDQASAGRGELRAAETSLAGGFVDLQHVHERGERYIAAASVAAVCPYLGLGRMTPSTPRTSPGASGCSASSSPLAGASLLVIVGPSGSGKSSALRAGCCRRWPAARCPGPTAGARRCCARASGPRRCSSGRCGRRPGRSGWWWPWISSRRRSPRVATRPSGWRSSTRWWRPRRPARSCARAAGRLLRTLRGAPGAGGAGGRQPGAGRRDAPGGVAAGHRAPGGARGVDGRAGAHRGARRRRGGRARRASAALDDARRVVAGARRAHAAHSRLRAQRRRARGRRPAGRADLRPPESARAQAARRILLRLAQAGDEVPSSAAGSPRRVRPRARRGRRRRAGDAQREPAGHPGRGCGGSGARGAAARVAPAAGLDRGRMPRAAGCTPT